MQILQLSQEEIAHYLRLAKNSPRRRALKILHEPGAALNRTINFMLSDTYLPPHTHPPEPGKEKVERYKILGGALAILFFDENGNITKSVTLDETSEVYAVHPNEWHTPLVLGCYALCYEEVEGVFDPATYREFAPWAPREGDPEAPAYLKTLKERATRPK